ncbi:NADH-quinone oxidoreductase subunit C, partial [Planctomycetota bacterium]
VAPQDLLAVVATLKTAKELSFDALMCLSGVDYPNLPDGKVGNFGVVYHLFSMQHRHKLVLRVELPKDNPSVASVANIWQTANWFEREAYDLYGIKFDGHPNLTRILMPDDWEGHPMRKDYKYPETYRELPL